MPLFDLVNLPYWILLGLGILLFLVVIVSGGGNDDTDLDVDADVDADMDADADAEADGMSFMQALSWLGFGKAPLMLLLAIDLSLWGLLGWMLNVFVGGVLGRFLGGFVGVIILVGSFILALVIGSQIANPVGKIFESFGEDTSSDRLIGCTGRVSTVRIPAIIEGTIGQVDVIDSARNLVTVNAILPDWATITPKRGDRILVIERLPQGYLVIAKDSPDQDRWLNQPS
ncbi:OB-fold-containig protein [Thermocoleostomius sinensis]|uniref:DUF1449 family protein n=1 Tax=Thermocoleostomius sinensis A174 TaxID=2016057 RepID=A0A9E8ZCB8_9CYAN|nr:OB-fold-containig protein [Thermocoleostomius sinensis]WAL60262.1 DUF1449 family protein [Thermocoleostomius sinensis A174]